MNLKNKYAKFAFTMTEALLAITILGVIAALMLRSINRVTPDKDKVMFLRAFHAMESAVSNAVNNQSYYDPDANAAKHGDFGSDPLPTARVELYTNAGGSDGAICTVNSNYPGGCQKVIKDSNAVCYLTAAEMSLTGIVNCDAGEDIMNYRTANGVCYYGMAGKVPPFEFVIDPSCKGLKYGYAVKVFPSGKKTVPKETSTYAAVFKDEAQQNLAYAWFSEQTDVKDRDYDFEDINEAGQGADGSATGEDDDAGSTSGSTTSSSSGVKPVIPSSGLEPVTSSTSSSSSTSSTSSSTSSSSGSSNGGLDFKPYDPDAPIRYPETITSGSTGSSGTTSGRPSTGGGSGGGGGGGNTRPEHFQQASDQVMIR